MSIPHFAMVISTVALASAFTIDPVGRYSTTTSTVTKDPVIGPHGHGVIPPTPRPQEIFEYFPDPRYPDQMVNPSFITAECTAEGIFQHPYNCNWYYRCHNRTGQGFFSTTYGFGFGLICESGTEFFNASDRCVKSRTCNNEIDINFCKTLSSSCRSCTVGTSQQWLCEFNECYSGGRDSGIQRICEQGQLHDGETCVEVSDCPNVSYPRGECPLNKLRPNEKWTDQASGCSEHTGCRAGRRYKETLCSSYYDCREGIKVHRYCPDGYFFSPQFELCIHPPQESQCF